MENRKLTNNFSLYEFIAIDGVPSALAINLRNIKAQDITNIETQLAPFSQSLRNWTNKQFQAENGREIGINIICGFRSLEWEKMQGRSGNGTHPLGIAIDFRPTNCKDDNMYMKVFYAIASKLIIEAGGFACKYPTYESGKIKTFGFIHKDFRNGVARWNY